jgi:O-antigen/teichoic acid export membrane protein
LDDILVGRVLGNRPLAFYRRAYNLGGLFHHGAGTVLTRVLFPLFAHQATDAGSANTRTFRTAVSCVSMVLTPAVCFAVFHADLIIGTVYGEKWLPCVPLFRILGGYAVLLPILEITKELLIAGGSVRESARAYWTMLVALAAALSVGLTWFGVSGAAVAVDVALFAGLVHASVAARRLVGISVFGCVWRAWGLCGAGSLVFVLCGRLFPAVSPFGAFVFGAFFWGGLCCAMLWYFEREALVSLFHILAPGRRER